MLLRGMLLTLSTGSINHGEEAFCKQFFAQPKSSPRGLLGLRGSMNLYFNLLYVYRSRVRWFGISIAVTDVSNRGFCPSHESLSFQVILH
jgi:hypothetical protein